MPDRILSRLPGGTILANVWPVGLGALTGDVVAQSAQWARPGLIAILSGAVLQLLIALLRSLFTERRDVLATLRDMLREQREATLARDFAEKRVRHDLANRAHVAEMKLHLLAAGVPPNELPPVRPLYDISAEDQAEEERRAQQALHDTRNP
jgi:hypothetical protein